MLLLWNTEAIYSSSVKTEQGESDQSDQSISHSIRLRGGGCGWSPHAVDIIKIILHFSQASSVGPPTKSTDLVYQDIHKSELAAFMQILVIVIGQVL